MGKWNFKHCEQNPKKMEIICQISQVPKSDVFQIPNWCSNQIQARFQMALKQLCRENKNDFRRCILKIGFLPLPENKRPQEVFSPC